MTQKILFQSTFSVRRATGYAGKHTAVNDISIHVLREESDNHSAQMASDLTLFQSTFSVRRATTTANAMLRMLKFQSTFSVRRATTRKERKPKTMNISIHVLREESDSPDPHAQSNTQSISIHVLREESDLQIALEVATVAIISIHVLREESDTTSFIGWLSRRDFNPRSP